MKKVFLFLLPLLIASCTEKEQFVTLSDSSVTLFYDGTKQLSLNYSSDELKSGTYTYSSSDSTIVSVTKTGLVSGISVGTATVKVSSADGKYSDECTFIVSPKSSLYKEPYTVFGSSITKVKSNESRTLYSESSTYLIYTDTDADVRNILYAFSSNQSTSALVLLTQTTSVAVEVTTFLKERYVYLGTSNSIYVFKNRKTGIGVGLTVDATLGLCVVYFPANTASTVVAQKIKLANTDCVNTATNEQLSLQINKILSH